MVLRFSQIFWGLMLVTLDFKLNEIDILPDFIGYFLFVLGCGGLVSASSHFSTARTLGCILLVLSLIEYVSPREIATVLWFITLAANCGMMWFLFGGVMELATARQRSDLFEQASKRRAVYIVLMLVGSLSGLLAPIVPPDVATIISATYLLSLFFVVYLILQLIFRARLELT